MINEYLTFEEFGYESKELSSGSNKKVFITCDYCGVTINSCPKQRKRANNVVDKDACIKCRYKKREDICLAEHGVTNIFAAKSTKEKIKKTNQKKYGSDWFVQTEEFKEKAKDTMLERYGVENALQNKDIQRKQEETIYKKYGKTNVSQVKEIRDKVKQTNLEKYGEEEFFNTDKFKDRN
jgi:hypothetical protein